MKNNPIELIQTILKEGFNEQTPGKIIEVGALLKDDKRFVMQGRIIASALSKMQNSEGEVAGQNPEAAKSELRNNILLNLKRVLKVLDPTNELVQEKKEEISEADWLTEMVRGFELGQVEGIKKINDSTANALREEIATFVDGTVSNLGLVGCYNALKQLENARLTDEEKKLDSQSKLEILREKTKIFFRDIHLGQDSEEVVVAACESFCRFLEMYQSEYLSVSLLKTFELTGNLYTVGDLDEAKNDVQIYLNGLFGKLKAAIQDKVPNIEQEVVKFAEEEAKKPEDKFGFSWELSDENVVDMLFNHYECADATSRFITERLGSLLNTVQKQIERSSKRRNNEAAIARNVEAINRLLASADNAGKVDLLMPVGVEYKTIISLFRKLGKYQDQIIENLITCINLSGEHLNKGTKLELIGEYPRMFGYVVRRIDQERYRQFFNALVDGVVSVEDIKTLKNTVTRKSIRNFVVSCMARDFAENKDDLTKFKKLVLENCSEEKMRLCDPEFLEFEIETLELLASFEHAKLAVILSGDSLKLINEKGFSPERLSEIYDAVEGNPEQFENHTKFLIQRGCATDLLGSMIVPEESSKKYRSSTERQFELENAFAYLGRFGNYIDFGSSVTLVDDSQINLFEALLKYSRGFDDTRLVLDKLCQQVDEAKQHNKWYLLKDLGEAMPTILCAISNKSEEYQYREKVSIDRKVRAITGGVASLKNLNKIRREFGDEAFEDLFSIQSILLLRSGTPLNKLTDAYRDNDRDIEKAITSIKSPQERVDEQAEEVIVPPRKRRNTRIIESDSERSL